MKNHTYFYPSNETELEILKASMRYALSKVASQEVLEELEELLGPELFLDLTSPNTN